MKTLIIHKGDAGLGRILCGAKEVKREYDRNWTWTPEWVTCKKCKAMMRKKRGRRG